MESHISEAVDEVDKLPEVVEEGFVGLLKFLHSDALFNIDSYRFITNYDTQVDTSLAHATCGKIKTSILLATLILWWQNVFLLEKASSY